CTRCGPAERGHLRGGARARARPGIARSERAGDLVDRSAAATAPARARDLARRERARDQSRAQSSLDRAGPRDLHRSPGGADLGSRQLARTARLVHRHDSGREPGVRALAPRLDVTGGPVLRPVARARAVLLAPRGAAGPDTYPRLRAVDRDRLAKLGMDGARICDPS